MDQQNRIGGIQYMDEEVEAKQSAEIYVVDFGEKGNSCFTGEGVELFSNWVQNLEDMLDLNPTLNTEMKANHLKFYLKGIARLYFDSLPDDVRKNYESAKDALKTKFEGGHIKAKAEEALGKLKQGGTVSELAVEVCRIVDVVTSEDTDDVRERKMMSEFINKLKPEIRFEVRKEEPTSFEDAVEMAMRVEALLIEREGDKGSLAKEVSELVKLFKQSTIMGDNRDGNSSYSDRFNNEYGNEGNHTGNCDYCGIFGHFALECRMRTAAMNNVVNYGHWDCDQQGSSGQNDLNSPTGFNGNDRPGNRFDPQTRGDDATEYEPRQQNSGAETGRWQRP